MDSIVLAGGFAKRMWPLTKSVPKQLLDVAGNPMLQHVLESISSLPSDRIVISVNSFFEPQFRKFLENYKTIEKIELYVEDSEKEEEKLGALGALHLLLTDLSIKGPVFIAGGDNLSDFNLLKMLKISEETNKDVIGLYDVNDSNLAKLYGIAELEGNRIIGFEEKPETPVSNLAATAYWLLTEKGVSNFFDYISSGGDRDAMGNFLEWNVRRHDIRSVSFTGKWYDIGSINSYAEAQKWFSS